MKIARHTLGDGNREARQPAKEAFDNEESRFWVEEAQANVAEICAADRWRTDRPDYCKFELVRGEAAVSCVYGTDETGAGMKMSCFLLVR
ncbi:hypothetical protein PVK06_014867 [Gossypium arboreum]|uniref:Uncharacterized protein n=1 Tax=Gossypium arboreum TaxID=29729 RepID=A0ABR0PVN5_GOSAR|nr:hypothetical protein PVK06_014867 [Gossypium arboreum]